MKYIQDFFGEYIGFYLDIGAYDGVTNSNTYALQELGWKGICVEPSPNSYDKLCENRLKGTISIFNVACVGDESLGYVDFFEFDDIPQFNGIAPDPHKVVREQLELGLNAIPFKHTKVEAMTVNNILGKRSVDFVSLDVEGTEIDVLDGFDLARYKPKLLCIENNDPRNWRLNDYMEARGYKVATVMEINTFYIPLI